MIRQSYRLCRTENARFLVVPQLEAAGAVHFFGLKAALPQSPDRLARFKGTRVITAKQVHGDRVWVVNGQAEDPEICLSQDETGNDALITREAGFFVGVYTADCLPILFMAPGEKVVAAVHAGWRGSLLRVAAKAAEEMIFKMGCQPEDLLAALGPGIGPCCYEVGDLVLGPLNNQFPEMPGVVRYNKNGKGMLDLVELNRRQLIEVGLRPENLYSVGLCTYCHPDLFSSYRREGKGVGGMLSGIMQAE